MPKFALLLVICLLLCSCSPQQEKTFETETETENATISETVVETLPESSAETTETHTIVITKTIDEENKPEEICTISEDGKNVLDLRALTGEDIRSAYYCGGDIVCSPFEKDEMAYIYVIDIQHGKVVNLIKTDFEYYSHPHMYYNGQLYMRFENENEEATVIKLSTDGSYEITEHESLWDIPEQCGKHWLIGDGANITDMASEEILLATDAQSYADKSASWYSYVCPIDDDRFVYYKSGYEWSNGVGVYDLSTHIATDMPDTWEKYFIMAANGKIYTEEGRYDYIGTMIYVSDTNKLETHLLTNIGEIGKVREYFAPDNGEYIGAFLYSGKILLIDKESGNIIREIQLPEKAGDYNYDVFFTDSFICAEYGGKIYMYPRRL
ncbi:MAG: hypothetical protein J1E40_02540 [Oscillospiraceae bacterium]|nr:hypothetical protein [Oscillospiraceae bacterium]